jgi:hypothetical protein
LIRINGAEPLLGKALVDGSSQFERMIYIEHLVAPL